MGGVWRIPHLVKSDAAAKKTEWPLDPVHVQDVVDGMYGVVNEGGTGAQAAIPGIEMCGKTGSAQLASTDVAKAAAARVVFLSMILLVNPSEVSVGNVPAISFNQISW